jgi:hypothetical protein
LKWAWLAFERGVLRFQHRRMAILG